MKDEEMQLKLLAAAKRKINWGLGGALWHIEHLINLCEELGDEGRKKRLEQLVTLIAEWMDELEEE